MTDHDHSDKSWLRAPEDDSFQILDPELAALLILCMAFIGYVFRGWL